MISIFTEKETKPTDEALKKALGNTYALWQNIADYTRSSYPGAKEEWHYPGAKYGWSFRISDKKRAIIYFLPRDKFFKVAFVFGNKATEKILSSQISESIKSELQNARVYAEGRGIRIDVKEDDRLIEDIKQLITIKIHS